MNESKPLISVLMGVQYRRTDLYLLKRSVESVLNQSCADFEFLICEANSTDEVKQYLQVLRNKDSRVHMICGYGADTLAAKLNRCIHAARGVYFARQDDDDASDMTRFDAQVEYLKSHPEIAFVGSVARLEQDNRIVGIRRLPEIPPVKDFLLMQPFLHPTLMFRASVFHSGILYCEDKRCVGCEDYDLLLRLYENGLTGANLQEPGFTYTLPPRGTSNRTWKMRCNEVYTRWVRFRSLHLLPKALPYVVKPLAVGFIPRTVLQRIKERQQCRE